jgi:fibronectin-binding autotransporter adhesin
LFLRCGQAASLYSAARIDGKQETTMNIFWKNTVTSGSFTSAANWVQGVVPGANDVAELTTSGATVIDNTTTTVLGLNLVSTGILAVQGNLTATEGTAGGANRGTIDISTFFGKLTVGGTFDNIGTINVSTGAFLNFQSFDATLKGSGTVSLNATFITIQNSSKLTNVDNTIEGQGAIQGSSALINQKNGVIDANFTNGDLFLAAPVTNSGLLEATGTNAALGIGEPVNNVGGFIAASGTARVVVDSDILGGTLITNAGGTIVANGATLDGTGGHVVTNNGTVTVQTGAQAALTGIINNFGFFTVASATLSVESATTIKGNALLGFIDLSNGGSLMGSPGAVLSNVSDTIFTSNGSGNIGGTGWELINESSSQIRAFTGASLTIDVSGSGGFVSNVGTIDALGGSLTIGGNVSNAGTIDTFGSPLTIGGNIRNTSAGQILSEEATVTLGSSGNIVGGTLSGVLGGFDVPNGAAFTLDGGGAVVPTNKVITINAPVTVEGTLNLQGTINNSGSVAIDPTGGGAVLVAQSVGKQTTVTLEGHGTVGLSDVPAGDVPNAITGGGAPVTLANLNNTINGGGTIGGGGLTLNNKAGGVINATGATLLVIDTGSNTVMNAGSMMATSGSTLVIGSNLSNTGKLNASGGTITVLGTETGGSAVISGGTGTVEFDAAATAGTTFATGTTGELILDDPAQYSGTVAGFGVNTRIDLPNFGATGAHATSYSGGVLTLTNTAGQTVKIKISGSHTLGSFNVSDDGNFNGTDDGTLITDPQVGHSTQAVVNLLGQHIASIFPTTVAGANTPLLAPAQAPNLLLLSVPHA